MSYKFGFVKEENQNATEYQKGEAKQEMTVRKSLVQVHFPDRGQSYAYYNDQFDLQCGDIVYVEGKLEGIRGRVTAVNYNFKIKLSDYKKVIAVADTDVHGEFYMAGSHFVTFDSKALPKAKVLSWFKAPAKEDEEYAFGGDDATFSLYHLQDMNVSSAVADRGHEYYMDNRVVYISLDGTQGYAIVEGTEPYEVEFECCDGEISNLVCSCFCSYPCKHEFAAMLQLRETLENIEKYYEDAYKASGYFAAVSKGAMFTFVVDRKENGKFEL